MDDVLLRQTVFTLFWMHAYSSLGPKFHCSSQRTVRCARPWSESKVSKLAYSWVVRHAIRASYQVVCSLAALYTIRGVFILLTSFSEPISLESSIYVNRHD